MGFCGCDDANSHQHPLCSNYNTNTRIIKIRQLQELDLSKEAFIFAESVKEEEWRTYTLGSLHREARYSLVKVVRLVGIMMLVFTKEQHLEHVTNLSVDHVGTGKYQHGNNSF